MLINPLKHSKVKVLSDETNRKDIEVPNKKAQFPTIARCPLKNHVRIIYDPIDNLFKAYICCAVEFARNNVVPDPFICFTKEDILKDDLYDRIVYARKLRKDQLIKMNPICASVSGQHYNTNYFCNAYNYDIQTIEVSIQHTCNLHCKMCGLRNNNFKENDELAFILLEKLKNHKLYDITLTQEGEPFYYKSKMLNYLNSLEYEKDFKSITITSNLTLLNDKDLKVLKNIKDKGFTIFFMASIDGLTSKTYESIRQNKLFDKVMKNANTLLEYDILKMVNFVIQPENLHELLEAKAYWESKNIKFNGILLNNDFQSDFAKNPIVQEYFKYPKI